MTEIPEHLLERSRAARARLTGVDAGGSAPATTSSTDAAATDTAAAPVAAAAAAPAPAAAAPPKPDLPWVAAGKARTKIPVWAMPVFAFLPIWAVMYMTTNDPESAKELGPVELGAEQYGACAACHGGAGGGGVGPAFTGGAILESFPLPAEQVRWVLLGTSGYEAEGTATYGATAKPVGGGGAMPAQGALTDEELLAVVRHEREAFGNEEFDQQAWIDDITTLAEDPNPEVQSRAEAMLAVVEGWEA